MSAGTRVAVIGRTGAGGYGHQLDQGFHAEPRCTVVAVADADPEAGPVKARELGARYYADHRDMLAAERPEVVVVAPRHTGGHERLVLDALDAGAHVYCEKPIGQDLEQADAMVAAARKRGLLLANAIPFVHEPRHRLLLDLLDAGRIGDIVQLRGLCKWDHRGGGQDFLILGVHFADLMRRLAGDPVSCFARVSVGGSPIKDVDIEDGPEDAGLVAGDRIIARYEFPGRIHGTIESWRLGIEDRGRQPYRLEIRGTTGILVVRAPYADHSLWYYPHPDVLPGGPGWERVGTEPVASYGQYHQWGAADLLDAIEQGRLPKCSGADGAAALEMIHAAYWSEIEGGEVALPLADRRHPLRVLRGDAAA